MQYMLTFEVSIYRIFHFIVPSLWLIGGLFRWKSPSIGSYMSLQLEFVHFLLEFSTTWGCVPLPRSTTSSGWKFKTVSVRVPFYRIVHVFSVLLILLLPSSEFLDDLVTDIEDPLRERHRESRPWFGITFSSTMKTLLSSSMNTCFTLVFITALVSRKCTFLSRALLQASACSTTRASESALLPTKNSGYSWPPPL